MNPTITSPSRRRFLRGGLATAAFGFPTIIPAKVLGQDAPSHKITMTSIGVGGMGKGNLGSFVSEKPTRSWRCAEPLGTKDRRLYRSENHHANFLDCVIARQPTIAPAETAHRSASVGHLGQIAMLTGRKIRWNPDSEEIIDDPGAAALLGRTNREPWSV